MERLEFLQVNEISSDKVPEKDTETDGLHGSTVIKRPVNPTVRGSRKMTARIH